MMNANTVKSILIKVAAGFTVFSVSIFTREGKTPSKGYGFDNAGAAIAAYGDEEVYEWKLESMLNGKVCVTIKLKSRAA
nr:MAG TPA: hypothetical protein [Caudoviricetes sp.]